MPVIPFHPVRVLGFVVALLAMAASPAAGAPAGSHAFPGFADVRPIGDFNGDGFEDLADRSGHIVFGAADLRQTTTATFDLPGSHSTGMQRLGDLDGDGYDDVSIGAVPQGAGTANGAYVLYGAPGTAGVPIAQGPRVGFVRTGPNGVGASLQGIGDFNGDGLADVAAYRRDKADTDPSMRAGYTVILGGPRLTSLDANVASARTVLLNGTTTCSVVTIFYIPIGYRCRDNSAALEPAGDVDGDGKDDLLYLITSPSQRGLIFGRAGSGTSMKLTAPTAPAALFDGNGQAGLPTAVGDLDGDGKADLMRSCAASSDNVALYRGRTVPAGSQFSTATPTWTLAGKTYCGDVVAVGDVDGDGGADLMTQQVGYQSVADGVGAADLRLFTGVRTRAPGATVPIASLPQLEGVAQVWAQLNALSSRPVKGGAGDLDGDGRGEILLSDEQSRAVIASHGADRLAPEVATRIVDPASLRRAPAVAVTPAGLRPGPGAAKISLVLDGPATVRFVVKRGTTAVGAFERTLPTHASDVTWDGSVDGTALADGDYALELTPRDAAGNAGITRSVPFTVGAGSPPVAASVSLSAKILAPDGSLFPGEVAWSAHCPDGVWPTQESGSTVPLGGGSRSAGQHCSVSVGFRIRPAGLEQCAWTWKMAVNGGTPVTVGLVDFDLNAGENTVAATLQCVGGRVVTPGRPEPFTSARWLKYGSARQQGSAVTLTTAGASQAGAVVWPDAFDPRGLTSNFSVTMSGGNATAEGIALAFLPATQPLPPVTAPLGPPGGTLGLGGLPSTAVTLDTFKQPTDPAGAFVGLATGSTGDHLDYVQTADPGIRLRTANLRVSVIYKGGVLTVLVNGKQRLQRAVTLPSSTYLAFSAATNATGWQQHVVSSLSVVPAA